MRLFDAIALLFAVTCALVVAVWLATGNRELCRRTAGPCELKHGQSSHGAVYAFEACPEICR